MLKLKNIFTGLMIVATLTVENFAVSVCAEEISINGEASSVSCEVAEDCDAEFPTRNIEEFFKYTLNNTEVQYQLSYTAGSNGEHYELHTTPTGGDVTLYVRSSRWASENLYTRVFDIGGHANSLEINMSPNTTYYFFLKASSAPTTGTVKKYTD